MSAPVRRFDVFWERDLDGVRIIGSEHDVAAADALALRMEHESLPGALVSWAVREHPRPWEPESAIVSARPTTEGDDATPSPRA